MAKEKSAKKIIQAPKGTFDILPPEQKYWSFVRDTVISTASQFGFERIDTPIFESTELFERGAGTGTDIVEKQMYTFKTKGKDLLTLRPEGTPGVVRSYLENGLANWPQPIRLYYIGPMFRYEQPQSGRYRQLHQFGFELIGEEHPLYDAWIINSCLSVLKELGLNQVVVEINSIGDSKCRPAFRKALINYYKNKVSQLCSDCQKRFKTNPLRLLDCKNEQCQELKSRAPNTVDYLCDDCRKHFTTVLEYMDELQISYLLNPHLVRGLDYYTRTVFEIFPEEEMNLLNSDAKDKKNPSAIAGGGRYDDLVQLMGGKATPAIGFAAGMERIINLLKKSDAKIPQSKKPEIFIVQLGELGRKKSLVLFQKLAEAGFKVAENFGRDSIKSQLKAADRAGVKLSLLLGQKEALEEAVILREMTTGVQETIPLEKIVGELKKRIKSIK